VGIHARRRAIAAAALVAVVVVAAGRGGESPPADRAAALVPDSALAYVHLSTDGSRAGVRRALDLAKRFPSYRGIRTAVLRRLTAPGCGIGPKDTGGHEAAVAVVGTGALVLIDTGHDGKPAPAHACGRVSALHVGSFLAIAPPDVLAQVSDLAKHHGRSLADDPGFRRSQADLPAGRFADGYLTAGGLRALLAPQAGLAGIAGVLLDRPGLTGLGFAAEARAPGVRLTVRELLAGRRQVTTFHPSLLHEVPAGALAALDVRDLGSAVRRLGGVITGLGSSEQRRIAGALRGEAVLWLTPATPAPRLTLVTPAGASRPGELPRTFAGAPLYSAVVGDRLVASTDVSGIAAARRAPRARLADDPAFREVLGMAPSQVTSLLFLNFSELLRLAEQTGLSNSRAYRKVRSDLSKVRAVGATSTGDADQTTLQVELSIP
jgi:hypothetical protein